MPLNLLVVPAEHIRDSYDSKSHVLRLTYCGRQFLTAKVTGEVAYEGQQRQGVTANHGEALEGSYKFLGDNVKVVAVIRASSEAFAAETLGAFQERFPVVRNSDGPSQNLRNNAVYDRRRDLLISGPADGNSRVESHGDHFTLTISGKNISLSVKPRFYQQHKNVQFFDPTNHAVTKRTISGWCSWWAYRDSIDGPTVARVAKIFADKLVQFGYTVIQLDDGYESGQGAPPEYWIKSNSKFPGGLPAVAQSIKAVGLEPGVWVGAQIEDESFAKSHPGWFVQDPDGQPHKGPWIGYGVNGNSTEGLKTMYGPVWDQIRESGFDYVKLDSLRHLLYDSLYPTRDVLLAKGSTPEETWCKYLEFARQRLGRDTYILACWGVLPEAAGIVDACRLGGDGFGPSTLQQYNSWNNVVWRNDPDHVDLHGEGDEIIRPTLVSMAGAQLLLSDKAEFYENDANLEGAKRASPVPFTLPGQLYDYDPSKTDNLVKGLRNQTGGSNAGPIDATQHGDECPWWQLDVSRKYEDWTVLARISWKPQPAISVRFQDLGLPKAKYAVYEFWSKRYLGDFEDCFPAEAQDPKKVHVYSIRKVVNHPQILSTSRHITQGGPDLESVHWDQSRKRLSGRSRVVKDDPYELRIRCAGLHAVRSCAQQTSEGELLKVDWVPTKSGVTDWWVDFQ